MKIKAEKISVVGLRIVKLLDVSIVYIFLLMLFQDSTGQGRDCNVFFCFMTRARSTDLNFLRQQGYGHILKSHKYNQLGGQDRPYIFL